MNKIICISNFVLTELFGKLENKYFCYYLVLQYGQENSVGHQEQERDLSS